MLKPIAALVLGGMLALGASAAGPVSPFDGSWTLVLEKSTFRPAPGPKELTRTITTAGDSITLTISGRRVDGSMISGRVQFRLDGKDYPLSGNPNVDTIAFTQTDARTWSTTTKQAGHVRTHSTLTVSADGATLSESISGTNASGKPVSNTMVFERR